MPTSKPIRNQMKKMASESRKKSSTPHKGVKKAIKEGVVKRAKASGKKKSLVSFARSQY